MRNYLCIYLELYRNRMNKQLNHKINYWESRWFRWTRTFYCLTSNNRTKSNSQVSFLIFINLIVNKKNYRTIGHLISLNLNKNYVFKFLKVLRTVQKKLSLNSWNVRIAWEYEELSFWIMNEKLGIWCSKKVSFLINIIKKSKLKFLKHLKS